MSFNRECQERYKKSVRTDRPTDRQTDIVVHREVKLPKKNLESVTQLHMYIVVRREVTLPKKNLESVTQLHMYNVPKDTNWKLSDLMKFLFAHYFNNI